MLSRLWSKKPGESGEMNIEKLKKALNEAESVLIGAGSGLSTSAGFVYTGERFRNYFSDFEERYGFHDMYSGGFYPYDTLEEHWAYWSRYIWINRYMDAPKPVYEKLLDLVKDKDYFVLTTNVDHCFQKAGFEKHRLFYTQGDYGLFQCSKPCHPKNYENEEITSILNEVKNISDKDLLKEKYNRIIEIYEDEVPYICLYRNKSKVVYSIRVTGNINPNNYTAYYNFEDWYRQ